MGQIEKNTVKAENQLAEDEYIQFYNGGSELKVLIVGNSITRHGINEEIGWFGDYGMAASSAEKDYVHIVMRELKKKCDASFCVCQASLWEMNYKSPDEIYFYFEKARDFDADVIIMRLIENVPVVDYDEAIFKREYIRFINYLNKKHKGKIVVTNGFWKHPGDDCVAEIAMENKYFFVALDDLGERDDMKAVGLFAHGGVEQHPGDKGMQMIAERILAKLV